MDHRHATTHPTWTSLADFVQPTEPKPARGEGVVESADLRIGEESTDSVIFTVVYHLTGNVTATVAEEYRITPDAVDGAWQIDAPDVSKTRVLFPALVNDGAHDLEVDTQRGMLEAHRHGCVLRWDVTSPEGVLLRKEGATVPSHNGYVRAIVGEVLRLRAPLTWRLTLQKENP